jgi:hypothetical protein
MAKEEGELSQQALNYIADSLEYYIRAHQICVVVEGISEKRYKKCMKKLDKVIKKLRKGETEGILKPSMVEVFKDTIEREARDGGAPKW